MQPIPQSVKKPASRLQGLRRWVFMLTVPFLGTLVMLTSLQRSLIYHPTRAAKLPAKAAGFSPGQAHDVAVQSDDQCQLRGWLILAHGHAADDSESLRRELSAGRPFVLYFSGNAGHRAHRHDDVRLLVQAGADVLICDYRGYGDSSGEPTEEGLARDARAVWKLATEDHKIATSRIVLFGESLGGGVAVRLASELEAKQTPSRGLILRSTFNSLPDAAAFHFPWIPVRWLLIDRFPSESRIRDVTCPILQFHGRRDAVIPIELGRRLFDAARDQSASGVAKRFVELPNADHNDVLETSRREVMSAIKEFLKAIGEASQ